MRNGFLHLLFWVGYCSIGWTAAATPPPPELEFLPNRGQWPAPVRLRTDVGAGLRVFLEDKRLVFLRYDAAAWAAAAHRHGARTQTALDDSGAIAPVAAHAWAVELVGARRATRPIADGKATGPVRNFFLGADPRHWATAVQATDAARYPEAWPGIAVSAHASAEGAFEVDFLVAPGADPRRIRLRYSGLDEVALDTLSGTLRLRTALGELREAAPVAWQTDAAGRRQAVPCRYGFNARHDVTFELPAGYDRTRLLIIDPVLVVSTYSGSTAPVFGYTATYDTTGHLYAAGPCYDPGYPVTLGAYSLAHTSGRLTGDYLNPDVAISRYSADGRRLLYATYVGGQSADFPHSLLVNHRGELLVLGSTESTDFPTSATAYDRRLNGFATSDAFVTKLDSTGATLLASTYLGGSGNDGRSPTSLVFFYGDAYRGDLGVDSLDRVFVATTTQSADFPFTPGAVRPPTSSSLASSAVVARLRADLSGLDWAAGLGDAAAAYGLYVPPSGAPYVVGATLSAGLPTTPGTLAPAPTGSPGRRSRDGFVAQLTANGSQVLAGTYLRPGTGQVGISQTFFVQPDPATSDVYVLGSSTGFYPASAGTWGQPGGGVIVQRLDAALTQRRWVATVGHRVTYGLGLDISDPNPETDNLSPTAFLVDDCGALYVSGWGRTQGLPVTPNALQLTTRTTPTSIGGDLYLAVFEPDAAALRYATFLGGTSTQNYYEEHVDGGTSRFDPHGRVYQAVCTNSHDFPTNANGWRPTNAVANAAYDEVAVKLDFEPRTVRAAAASATPNGQATTTFEAPADVHFTNQSSSYPTTSWLWDFGDNSPQSTAFAPTHLYPTPGTYIIRLITTDSSVCGTADTVFLRIIILPNDSTDYVAYTICRGDSVRFSAIGAAPGSFRWSPDVRLSDATAVAPVASPRQTTTYVATGRVPGTAQRNTWRITVTVLAPDTVLITPEQYCLPGGIEARLRLSAPLRDAVWDFGDGSPPLRESRSESATHFYAYPGTYTARVRGLDAKGCRTGTEVTLAADELFVPNVFTPNADGRNDTFEVGCLTPGTATLRVYNRWGRLVYDSGVGGYLNQWDGSGLSAGLYFYHLNLSYSVKAIRGWVQVVR